MFDLHYQKNILFGCQPSPCTFRNASGESDNKGCTIEEVKRLGAQLCARLGRREANAVAVWVECTTNVSAVRVGTNQYLHYAFSG